VVCVPPTVAYFFMATRLTKLSVSPNVFGKQPLHTLIFFFLLYHPLAEVGHHQGVLIFVVTTARRYPEQFCGAALVPITEVLKPRNAAPSSATLPIDLSLNDELGNAVFLSSHNVAEVL
jgi:hypothetical protein